MNPSTPMEWNNWQRELLFPVTKGKVFMAHAAVTALPLPAVEAMERFAEAGSHHQQEAGGIWEEVQHSRSTFANFLGCSRSEVALLGPTSLGLNMVANGLNWRDGDEVVYYRDDYPANVYPWLGLARVGVQPVSIQTERTGEVTWATIEPMLTARTKLVSLASASFLTGYRPDLEEIGSELKARGILFCLDGIQTLGAFPTSLRYVDFLSADAHKWMLGPVAAGLFMVKESCFENLRPTLLGSWNVVSPGFIAQDEIRYYEGARRYEPGTLNIPGILGMEASVKMLMEVGMDAVAQKILQIRSILAAGLLELGFEPFPSRAIVDSPRASGILSVTHSKLDLAVLWKHLDANQIVVSQRETREGVKLLRFSPHFYNTKEEVARVLEVVHEMMKS